MVDNYKVAYPINLGDTVYDVKLRGVDGKYTKKNASVEHSIIESYVVTSKNYFQLADKYRDGKLFTSELDAQSYIKVICSD